jgi:hypothetical protein
VFFKEHLKIPVAPSTLYEFVKSRARPAKKPMVTLRTVREQPSGLPKEPPGFQFDAAEQSNWKPKPEKK